MVVRTVFFFFYVTHLPRLHQRQTVGRASLHQANPDRDQRLEVKTPPTAQEGDVQKVDGNKRTCHGAALSCPRTRWWGRVLKSPAANQRAETAGGRKVTLSQQSYGVFKKYINKININTIKIKH